MIINNKLYENKLYEKKEEKYATLNECIPNFRELHSLWAMLLKLFRHQNLAFIHVIAPIGGKSFVADQINNSSRSVGALPMLFGVSV